MFEIFAHVNRLANNLEIKNLRNKSHMKVSELTVIDTGNRPTFIFCLIYLYIAPIINLGAANKRRCALNQEENYKQQTRNNDLQTSNT